MCSPIGFTRACARATRMALAGAGAGGAPNACANAAARGVEAMGVEMFPSSLTGVDEQHTHRRHPAEKQVLRAGGAQDDKLARFGNESNESKENHPPMQD